MKKRSIRCYEFKFEWDNKPNKVYYLIEDGWKKSLGICINCGELFVVDWENPKTSRLSIAQLAKGQRCPKCDMNLELTLKEYPDTFLTEDGELSHFELSTNEIPPDEESLIIEVWEISPA